MKWQLREAPTGFICDVSRVNGLNANKMMVLLHEASGDIRGLELVCVECGLEENNCKSLPGRVARG